MTQTVEPDQTAPWAPLDRTAGGPDRPAAPLTDTAGPDYQTGPAPNGPATPDQTGHPDNQTGPEASVRHVPRQQSGPTFGPGWPDQTTGPDYGEAGSRRHGSGGEREPDQTEDQTGSIGKRIVWTIVGVALTLVIAAPIALSSQHLYHWGQSKTGLNLGSTWAHGVYIALDLAAIVCIGMTLVAAWRRERAVVFQLLVWVFAGTSAYSQYSYGLVEAEAGRALDAVWAMPAFALLGPLLLEFVLHTVRRWWRKDVGDHVSPLRWFVAFKETRRGWVIKIRDGVTHAEGIKRVREIEMIGGLGGAEAILVAQHATRLADPYALRTWLAERGVKVTKADLEEAAERRLVTRFDTGLAGPVDDLAALPPAGRSGPDRMLDAAKPQVRTRRSQSGPQSGRPANPDRTADQTDVDEAAASAANARDAKDRADAERIWYAIKAEARDVTITDWAQAKAIVASRRGLSNKVIARSGTGKSKFYRIYERVEQLYDPAEQQQDQQSA